MMIVRIFGAVCALLAVFLFGMWLAWPELPYNPSGFPIDRKFLALSLNGEPLMLRDAPNLATLEVRGHLTFRHRVGGPSLYTIRRDFRSTESFLRCRSTASR